MIALGLIKSPMRIVGRSILSNVDVRRTEGGGTPLKKCTKISDFAKSYEIFRNLWKDFVRFRNLWIDFVRFRNLSKDFVRFGKISKSSKDFVRFRRIS